MGRQPASNTRYDPMIMNSLGALASQLWLDMLNDCFRPNRALLNPNFEGYRLEPISQTRTVRRYALSRRPTQATTSTRFPLAFEEMRSRITHNHLCVDSDSGLAVYVDDEFNVCLISVPMTATAEAEEDSTSPSLRILCGIPTPMDASSNSGFIVQKEYPSSAFISSTAVAVTDGNGLLYILPIKDEHSTIEPVGILTLRTGGVGNAPFRIHHCHRASPVTAVLLLSSRYYPDVPKSATNPRAGHALIEFDIWAVKLELLSLKANLQPQELEVLWHRRGKDVPIYASFVEELRTHVIMGGSSYSDPNISVLKLYEPAPDEMAPIPTINENLDAPLGLVSAARSEGLSKPHPYSWLQTPDSVTVAFPLPASTPKSVMRILFTMQTLTLHVDTPPIQSSEVPPVPIPHYTTTALWDSVNPSSCFWTWDREAEHAYGLLTLHMEKKNEGTRWMQVFAASAVSTGVKGIHAEGDQDVEVPESVDPSEMVKIREVFQKWTGGVDESGLGLGSGVPSLMGGELDEEVDADVGRQVWLTWVGQGGQTPEWYFENKSTQAGSSGSGGKQEKWEDLPITVLSTPLPGSVTCSADVKLVLKHDLDGTVFSLKVTEPGIPVWEHTSTFSALAFVLASKQDTRFTHHLPARGAFAFEGGSLRDRGSNVYIYRPSTKEKWAKQSVLQVDNGSGGALLGVGCVKVSGGKQGEVVLVCLTEGELVLIRGL